MKIMGIKCDTKAKKVLMILKMCSSFFWDFRRVTESMETDVSRKHNDVIFKDRKSWKNEHMTLLC